MKMRIVPLFAAAPTSFRIACDISLAWRPMWLSPISPSSSAFGTRADTESINDIKSTRLSEGFDNFQSLFAIVRLGDDEVFNVDSQTACVAHHQCVLRIDNRCESTFTLGLCND